MDLLGKSVSADVKGDNSRFVDTTRLLLPGARLAAGNVLLSPCSVVGPLGASPGAGGVVRGQQPPPASVCCAPHAAAEDCCVGRAARKDDAHELSLPHNGRQLCGRCFEIHINGWKPVILHDSSPPSLENEPHADELTPDDGGSTDYASDAELQVTLLGVNYYSARCS
jgi:hypothetical protein